jgi:acetolactate synthase-1/2/3 large subunit
MKNILVVVGAGARTAEVEVKEFLKRTDLPFVTTWGAMDMFTYDYPNYIGNFGITGSIEGNKAVQESDFLIVFGSRLDTHQTGSNPSTFAPKAIKLVVDIDNNELMKNKGVHIDFPICADIKELLNGYR